MDIIKIYIGMTNNNVWWKDQRSAYLDQIAVRGDSSVKFVKDFPYDRLVYVIGTRYHVYSFTKTFRESCGIMYANWLKLLPKVCMDWTIILFPAETKIGRLHYHGFFIYDGVKIADASMKTIRRNLGLYGKTYVKEMRQDREHPFLAWYDYCRNDDNYNGYLQEHTDARIIVRRSKY